MCVQGTQENIKRRVENVRKTPIKNDSKAMGLMLMKNLINHIEAVKKRETSESFHKKGPTEKETILMQRKHLINLAEDVKEKGSLIIGINSIVISWPSMGVARALIMSASEPMVGWKDEHP
jgi:hypothetical protein